MPRRLSTSTLAVLRSLVDDPTAERYGLEIAAEAGRPRRRYYRLTGSGVKHAERELHQAVQRLVLLRTLQPGTTS
jgi:DNA-binding PadR family transcriptional regulator